MLHSRRRRPGGSTPIRGPGTVPVTPEPVSAAAFARAGLTVLNRLAEQALPEVARAARLIADCVAGDGVVQAFGTDHSQAMVLEVAGRAGGLVPTNRIAI